MYSPVRNNAKSDIINWFEINQKLNTIIQYKYNKILDLILTDNLFYRDFDRDYETRICVSLLVG